jgi:hypothetical protein
MVLLPHLGDGVHVPHEIHTRQMVSVFTKCGRAQMCVLCKGRGRLGIGSGRLFIHNLDPDHQSDLCWPKKQRRVRTTSPRGGGLGKPARLLDTAAAKKVARQIYAEGHAGTI